MRHLRELVVGGLLTAAAVWLLFVYPAPPSVSAPGIKPGEPAINPLAMMMQAPLNLPDERYDAF